MKAEILCVIPCRRFLSFSQESFMLRSFHLFLFHFLRSLRRSAVTVAASVLAVAALSPANAATPAPEGAEVYFISPQNGQTVSNPVLIRFGLKGMGVAPAGIDLPNTGHHHLIINRPQPKAGEPIPTDDNHRHFGAGQTEASLTLPPGRHTLQLVLGDFAHTPHVPPVVSRTITITVK